MIQLPMPITHVGYVHGQRNVRGELHPGYDLNYGKTPNADLGLPIHAPVPLAVVYTGARKYYGNYVVAVNEVLNYAFRFLHLNEIKCEAGQRLSEGSVLGTCGNSHYGGWPGMTAHLHYDIIYLKALREKKLGWLYWPDKNTTEKLFSEIFVDPAVLHPELLRFKNKR